MSKLQLSIAIGDYDRNRPLIDGRVKIDGVHPVVMTLTPEEMFFRAMRHEAFDLKGKRVGLPEWQLTANVWTRALFEEEYGVSQRDIHWVRGGLEDKGRLEKLSIVPPKGVVIEDIRPDQTLNQMLMDGDIDAYIGPRAPSSFIPSNPTLSWIFPDPTVEAVRFYEKTKIFPVMHLVGVRKSLAEQHPWGSRWRC